VATTAFTPSTILLLTCSRYARFHSSKAALDTPCCKDCCESGLRSETADVLENKNNKIKNKNKNNPNSWTTLTATANNNDWRSN
jgi:hypothetical protein